MKNYIILFIVVLSSCSHEQSKSENAQFMTVVQSNNNNYKKKIDDFLKKNNIQETENREELFTKLDKMKAAYDVLSSTEEQDYFKKKSKAWYKSFSNWRDEVTLVQLQTHKRFTIEDAEKYLLKKYDNYMLKSYKDLKQDIDSSGKSMTLTHKFVANLQATGMFNSDKQTVTISFFTKTDNKTARTLQITQNYSIDGFEIKKQQPTEWK